MEVLAPYGALFASAFLAATLLPASSELVLLGLLAAGRGDPVLLIIAATVGNTAGSLVNWAIGRGVEVLHGRRWFPVSRERYEQAVSLFRRYGVWTLLFAWLPIIGDALTVAAGAARVGLWWFVALVGLGKAARYVAIAAGQAWATG
ncbi:YqaA family protein [Mesorhizobium sp. NPDC059054]|uniref:YqaA family protein n=1 Tax=Mesorhizobium sp. NPDC059054 TaxID=3346711 RepID=UPI0036CFB88C